VKPPGKLVDPEPHVTTSCRFMSNTGERGGRIVRRPPAAPLPVGMLVLMLALVTSSKVILAITGGIPTLLALIAFGAVLTRPKH
jgi:hypothetical protein